MPAFKTSAKYIHITHWQPKCMASEYGQKDHILVLSGSFTTLSAMHNMNRITRAAVGLCCNFFFVCKTFIIAPVAEQAVMWIAKQSLSSFAERCGNKPRPPYEYSTHSSLTLRWASPWPLSRAPWIIISTTYLPAPAPAPTPARQHWASPRLSSPRLGPVQRPVHRRKSLLSEGWSACLVRF